MSNDEYQHQRTWPTESMFKDMSDKELEELKSLKVKGQRYRDASIIYEELRMRRLHKKNDTNNNI